MTLSMRRLLPRVVILILWADVCTGQAVGDASPSALAGEWSAPVDGVRGRLLRTWYADNGAMQLRIDLELERVAEWSNPIEIRVGRISRMLDLAVEDSTGAALPRVVVGGNEFSPLPYMLALPAGSTIQILLSAAALEHRADEDSALLRPLGFQAWDVSLSSLPGLYLSGVFRVGEAPSENRNTWQGALQLPPVALK